VHHSERIDSFCLEEEQFFRSYEAEGVNPDELRRELELDGMETKAPTAEQRAHSRRFRRPVAYVMAGMSALSFVGLAQRGFPSNSRREGHAEWAIAIPRSASREHAHALRAKHVSSKLTTAGVQSSGVPWSQTEFAESAFSFALRSPAELLKPPPNAASVELTAMVDSPTNPLLVNDFTSALLSICRNAPA